MPPLGYSQTFWGVGQHVCFAPNSRHSKSDVRFSTENVCLALKSRRSAQVLRMSDSDPTRTLGSIGWERQESAKIGPSQEARAMSAVGSKAVVRTALLKPPVLTPRRHSSLLGLIFYPIRVPKTDNAGCIDTVWSVRSHVDFMEIIH